MTTIKSFQRLVPKILGFLLFWYLKSQKTSILAHFRESYCALLRTETFFDLGKRTMAQNDRNIILMKWVNKIFKIFQPKNSKNRFFEKIDFLTKTTKNDQKNRKSLEKIFLIGIDLEWFKNVF